MKRLALVGILAVTGCVEMGPSKVVYRPGSTGEQRLSALTQCQTLALSQVPRAMTTTVTPTYRTPSNVQCTTYGNYTNCYDYGGQTYGGYQQTSDVNAELRDRVTEQCLLSKGYQAISLPNCGAEQAKRAISSIGNKQPTADKIECVTDSGYALKP